MNEQRVITDASGTKVFVDRRNGQANLVVFKPSGKQMAHRIELRRKELDALIDELTKMRNQK